MDLGGALVDGDEGSVLSKAQRGELPRDEGRFFVNDFGFLFQSFEGETKYGSGSSGRGGRREGGQLEEGREGKERMR